MTNREWREKVLTDLMTAYRGIHKAKAAKRGVRKGTKLRSHVAYRLANWREMFWLAWGRLPEHRDSQGPFQFVKSLLAEPPNPRFMTNQTQFEETSDGASCCGD